MQSIRADYVSSSEVRIPPRGAGPRAERVEARAAALYASGYWCGESVVKAVSEEIAADVSPYVMRMTSGFCEGMGGSRCVCGALAGAVMAGGLICGRSSPDEDWEPSYQAAAELRRRFVESEDAGTCDEIVARIGDMSDAARWAHCTELVGRCARWVVEIAEAQGRL